MKKFLVTILLLMSYSSFSQSIITADKTNEDADLCFYKQVQLKGYAYANIIGRCAWDPAMNGMFLRLVAVPENPTEEAHALNLDNVREVRLVENKLGQIQISVVQDNFDSSGNVIQNKKVIYVRSLFPKKALFSVKLN
jgi:hypothetical protein